MQSSEQNGGEQIKDINLDEIYEDLLCKVKKVKPKLQRNDKVCGTKRTFGESEISENSDHKNNKKHIIQESISNSNNLIQSEVQSQDIMNSIEADEIQQFPLSQQQIDLNNVKKDKLKEIIENAKKKKTHQRYDVVKMQGEFEAETLSLMSEMREAVKEDHENIKLNKPALCRIILSGKVLDMLRKKYIQIQFLDKNGCQLLADWIDQNPDGSFPFPQTVELAFDILDKLPVQLQNLQDSQLVRTMNVYAENLAEMPELAHKALSILQKWQAVIFNLSYKYDKEGQHEQKQRQLRSKLLALQKKNDSDMEQYDLIQRNASGQIMFQNSNFDFIEKPISVHEPTFKISKNIAARHAIDQIFQKMKANRTAIITKIIDKGEDKDKKKNIPQTDIIQETI